MATTEMMLDMNRVEGDLRLRLQLDEGQVTDAWTVGTMYRGFEQLLIGRAPMDALVITPRVCGICGTAHLYAAVTAIERALQCAVAPNGTRIRNLCLMAEEVQSDTRHAFLMFTIDLCNEKYASRPGYDEIMAAFEPFKGRVYTETVVATKKILEVVAIYGGQWPHSSHMVPGGVVSTPSRRSIVKSLAIVDAYIRWYEQVVLGCSLDRWAEVQSLDDLQAWLDESAAHRDGAMGLFVRFTRALDLQALGRGAGNMLSYGSYFDPDAWQPPYGEQKTLRAAGFYDAQAGQVKPLSQLEIAEHVRYSWFQEHGDAAGVHPWKGETIPAYDAESEKYTWAKAPRYADQVVEVGAFPELFMAGDPLTRSLYAAEGTNVWSRQFLRLHRPTHTLRQMRTTLLELEREFSQPYIEHPKDAAEGEGFGLVEAARGALGHWIQFSGGKITRYQIITPTAWNASPRDASSRRGHWEQTLLGTRVEDQSNPVELGHIIRSHDACLVCTVHFLDTGRTLNFGVG